MANRFAIAVGAACLALIGCDDSSGPSGPTPPGSVRIAYLGSTTRRSDLPPSAQACVNGVGPTHIHPSWRSFAGIPLQPVPPNRYEIVFTDVPFDTRVTFRINDQNSCDQNPTGAVTQRPGQRRKVTAERHDTREWRRTGLCVLGRRKRRRDSMTPGRGYQRIWPSGSSTRTTSYFSSIGIRISSSSRFHSSPS
jgi:hypothetical protein